MAVMRLCFDGSNAVDSNDSTKNTDSAFFLLPNLSQCLACHFSQFVPFFMVSFGKIFSVKTHKHRNPAQKLYSVLFSYRNECTLILMLCCRRCCTVVAVYFLVLCSSAKISVCMCVCVCLSFNDNLFVSTYFVCSHKTQKKMQTPSCFSHIFVVAA